MPTYKVTDPSSGKTLRLTGDSPPTEAELEEIFASQGAATSVAKPSTPRQPGMIERVLNPFATERQVIGDKVAADVQTAKDVVGATAIGQAAKVATAAPVTAAADYITGPKVVSDITREALNPWNALAVLKGKRAIDATKQAVAPAVQKAGQVVTKPVTESIEFLKGSPKRVDASKRATHDFIQSIRQGGPRHDAFFERMGALADEAWEPMRQVSTSIDEPIHLQEVAEQIARQFPDQPETASQVIQLFRSAAGKQKVFSAPDIVDISSRLGRSLPGNVMKGKAAPRQAQQMIREARSAIGDILEAKAPEHLKGAVGQAKQQWASYKADQAKLFEIFSPGGAKELETKAGVNFVQRAGHGKLTQSEKDFLARLQTKFPEINELMQQVIQQSGKASSLAEKGRLATRVATGAVGTGAVGTVLGYMLGKR